MNHSTIIREEAKRDQHQLLPERTNPIRAAKAPSPFPYIPTHVAPCQLSVPWMVDQQPPGPAGDNSLTALQIAKSLSEVDFFPSEQRGPSIPSQRPGYRNGPSMHGDRGYSWDKEVGHSSQRQFVKRYVSWFLVKKQLSAYFTSMQVSVLQGAPKTVRELLSALGLQKYTLGLSLNGWDDLDYFR